MTPVPLRRRTAAARNAGIADEPAAVGLVHLGLGAFHRAHQAWYTAHATDTGRWGISAYTGRDPHAAQLLAAQDGVYALVTRGPDDDEVELIGALSAVSDGGRVDLIRADLARPEVGVVTLTVTEVGYHLTGEGRLDVADPAVRRDIDCLAGGEPDAARTPLGRLLAGLDARRRADAGPIAVVPCDNLPGNGRLVRDALLGFAEHARLPELARWIDTEVRVVSTSVDRITPHTPDRPVRAVVAAGWDDASPVITEPFTDWVLAGDFPAGRPRWEDAGARFVTDIEPWENRKLWLLNGAHTILAAAGTLRGHTTVDEAADDPLCRDTVTRFWDDAVTLLPPETDHETYRGALWTRFENRRLRHTLAQIATDARTKVRLRVVAVAERLVGEGRSAAGAANALAWWLAGTSITRPAQVSDTAQLVGGLSESLAAHDAFVHQVHQDLTDVVPAGAEDRS